MLGFLFTFWCELHKKQLWQHATAGNGGKGGWGNQLGIFELDILIFMYFFPHPVY